MPNVVNFILFGADYFYIPINILELCSRTQLSYFERDPLGSCFSDFLGGVQSCAQSRTIYSLQWRHEFLEYPTQCAMNYVLFPLAGRKRHYSQFCVSTGHCPLILPDGFPLASSSFLKCICWSVLCWIPEKEPLQITLSAVLSLLVRCLASSSSLHLPRLSIQGAHQPLSGFSFLMLQTVDSLKAIIWGNYRAHLIS